MTKKARNPQIEALENAGIMKRSEQIIAPGPLKYPHPDQDHGGTVAFRGPTGCGKTIVMMTDAEDIIENDANMSWSRTFGNKLIYRRNYVYMCTAELIKLLYRAFDPDSPEFGLWCGCIFMLFESDASLSHLDSSEKKQEKKLLNLSQATCLNDYFMTEYHEGLGQMRIIRDKTEIIVEPTFDREKDMIHRKIYNGQKEVAFSEPLLYASRYFDMYDRTKPAL